MDWVLKTIRIQYFSETRAYAYNSANRYSIKNIWIKTVSYESVILRAPSVERSKFNGPASLYRHVIELKKSTQMQRCIAPAGKKTIEKKPYRRDFFSHHRHLRAESFASFIKSDLSFSHWVTSNRPWKYARRYPTPRENTSRREKNFVHHKERRKKNEKRNKKVKEREREA